MSSALVADALAKRAIAKLGERFHLVITQTDGIGNNDFSSAFGNF